MEDSEDTSPAPAPRQENLDRVADEASSVDAAEPSCAPGRWASVVRWRRLARCTALLAAASILVAASSILLLRFVPPPTSAMILQHRWAAAHSESRPPEQLWAPWSEISPHLALAVVAAEDQRFLDHWGLDTEAIAKAREEGRQGKRQRGASTLTQQVAKNLFLWPGRSYLRKGLEAGLAVALEVAWPKRRILEVYLNYAQLGEAVYGAEAASRRFFAKPAAQLTREEAALLAAVLPNPVRFRVDQPSAYVLRRQAWILQQMRQLDGPDGPSF